MKLLIHTMILVVVSLFLAPSGTDCQTNQFQKYLASLRILNTPLRFDCVTKIHCDFQREVDTILTIRFKPKDTYFVGGVFPEARFVALIFAYPGSSAPYPSLYTFTHTGKPIDTLFLPCTCESDEEYGENYVTLINADQTISILDTLAHRKVDENGEPVPGINLTTIDESKYRITANGRIEKLGSYNHTVPESDSK